MATVSKEDTSNDIIAYEGEVLPSGIVNEEFGGVLVVIVIPYIS